MPLKLRYVVITQGELSDYNRQRDHGDGQYCINFVMKGGVYDRDEAKILCIVDDLGDAWKICQAMNLVA